MATDLVIGIGAKYTGSAAFAKASKEVSGLDKAVNKLGKQLASVFAARKIYQFGKASTQAFLQDNAAAAQLGKTIQNLGLAYDSVQVEKFINQLQITTGVLDDQLRPAFGSLLLATKDFTKSQELLGLALDISAGTGKDLSAVSQALSKAYLGNFASLTRLGGGISKADIASGNFLEIQKKLNQNFKGDALAAVKTYSGQMRVLSVAADTAKESIGQGLVVALSKLSGDNITNLAGSMERFGKATGETIVGIGVLGAKIQGLSKNNGDFLKVFSLDRTLFGQILKYLQKLGQKELASVEAKNKIVTAGKKEADNSTKVLTNTTKLTAEQTKQLALKKAQSVLDTSSKVLDIDLIQNAAALQGKITQDETTRLQLQQAILLGNASAAGKLAQELAATQIAAMKSGATDPYASWSEGAKTALAGINAVRSGLASLGVPTMAVPTPTIPATIAATVPATISNVPAGGYNGPGGVGAGGGSTYFGGTKVTIDLNLNGDLNQLVTGTVIDNTANGNTNSLARNYSYAQMAS